MSYRLRAEYAAENDQGCDLKAFHDAPLVAWISLGYGAGSPAILGHS
jgi:hypothetical protein